MKIAIIIVIVLLLALCECIRELRGFKVTHYTVVSDKLSELTQDKRVVVLSDLHNHIYGHNNDVLFQAIQKQRPDFILIAGDMIIGKKGIEMKSTVDFITKLPQLCPVYYANGNHEQRMKEYPKWYGNLFTTYQKQLKGSGVVFLENSSRICMLDEAMVEIYGLELPMTFYDKFKNPKLTQKQLRNCIGESNSNIYQIVIAHNPTYFEDYRDWGADLVVSGHLHGGVIRIPGWRGVITPQARLFPKYSGEMTSKESSSIVVSKGLGTHTVNIRLFNHAEVVVIHLHKKGV